MTSSASCKARINPLEEPELVIQVLVEGEDERE